MTAKESVGHGRRRLLYIVGMQNSGSTVLEAVLAEAPGVGSLGEVGGFHRHRQYVSCDCGAPSASCELCAAVVNQVGGGGAADNFAGLHELAVKEKNLHRFVLSSGLRRRYAEASDQVFDAVFEHSSWSVLIDSSKNISRAIALAEASSYDVYLVHLVRDCRGYFYSRNRRLKIEGKRPQYLRPGVKWLAKNVVVSLYFNFLRRRQHFLTMTYEEFVTRPAASLRRLSEFVGVDFLAARQLESRKAAPRSHLFEPPRMVDYSCVRLEPDRLQTQRWSGHQNTLYWMLGGFVSAAWGYDRQQSYLSSLEWK